MTYAFTEGTVAMHNHVRNCIGADGPTVRDILTVWFKGLEMLPHNEFDEAAVSTELKELKALHKQLVKGRFDVLNGAQWVH